VGGQECVFFPENLLIFLHRNGCFTWDKLISSWSGPIPLWKDGHDLHLPGPLLPVWKSVKETLCSLGIHRSGTEDHLMWIVPNAKSPARVKDIYTDMISSKAPSSSSLYPLVDGNQDALSKWSCSRGWFSTTEIYLGKI